MGQAFATPDPDQWPAIDSSLQGFEKSGHGGKAKILVEQKERIVLLGFVGFLFPLLEAGCKKMNLWKLCFEN